MHLPDVVNVDTWSPGNKAMEWLNVGTKGWTAKGPEIQPSLDQEQQLLAELQQPNVFQRLFES